MKQKSDVDSKNYETRVKCQWCNGPCVKDIKPTAISGEFLTKFFCSQDCVDSMVIMYQLQYPDLNTLDSLHMSILLDFIRDRV